MSTRTDAKREADLKYYHSAKGRLNRWRKGELDARDAKLRSMARKAGLTVYFTGVDSVVVSERKFSGAATEAIQFLKAAS